MHYKFPIILIFAACFQGHAQGSFLPLVKEGGLWTTHFIYAFNNFVRKSSLPLYSFV